MVDDNETQMLYRQRQLKTMPCGGTPIADMESSIGAYRCDHCFAVIGSIGQSQRCKEINGTLDDSWGEVMSKLPNKLSALILVALADMEAARKRGFLLDMNLWVYTSSEVSPRPYCSVCMAGAVMIGTFGANPEEALSPGMFFDEHKLDALNDIRCADLVAAYKSISKEDYSYRHDLLPILLELEAQLETLIGPDGVIGLELEDPNKYDNFVAAMKWLSAELSKHNL